MGRFFDVIRFMLIIDTLAFTYIPVPTLVLTSFFPLYRLLKYLGFDFWSQNDVTTTYKQALEYRNEDWLMPHPPICHPSRESSSTRRMKSSSAFVLTSDLML